MSQLALIAAILPTIFRVRRYTWKQVPGGRDPVWALDRVPAGSGRQERNASGDLVVEKHAYRIARHPFKDASGKRVDARERRGWTVDVCWAVAPIWEPYLDGPFATPQEAAEAVAQKGLQRQQASLQFGG
jgi:hypothetical protein